MTEIKMSACRLILYPLIALSCLWGVQGAGFPLLLRRVRAAADTQTTDSPSSTPVSEVSFTRTSWSPANSTEPHMEVEPTEAKEVERFHVAEYEFSYVADFLVTALFIFFVCAAKVVYRSKEVFAKRFPESCMLIVCGAILGIIMYFCNAPNYQLHTHVFFLAILPPIMFDAGYFMPPRAFFDNLGTIVTFAVFGTMINALMLGWTMYGISTTGGLNYDKPLPMLNVLTHASILSAVDPVAVIGAFEAVHVNDCLYIVVFGEALLNDGIAVVLYRIFNGFATIGAENVNGQDIGFGVLSFFVLVVCSPALGICFAFVGGFLSRFTKSFRQSEPFLVFTIGYISFMVAEMVHLSGILSSTFCGIVLRKYVEHNFHKKSKTTIKMILRTMAQICEGIIFLYLGVAAVNEDCDWSSGYVLLVTMFCVVFRFVGCYAQTYIVNMFRHRKLDLIDQFIMSYSGLRGAIAFALTYLLDDTVYPERRLYVTTTMMVVFFSNMFQVYHERRLYVTTTMVVVFFSMMFQGTTVEPMVAILRVARKNEEKPTMNTKVAERVFDHALGGIEAVINQGQYIGYHGFRMKFSEFNNNVLKPLIVGKKEEMPGTHRGHQLQKIYFRLSEQDARALIRTPSCATDINRYGVYVKRQNSTADLSRVDTETSLFNPRLWGLPSFTIEDRRKNVSMGDDKEMIERQVAQAVAAANIDKSKYAKHYTSRARNNLASSSSAANLTGADNDLDISTEEQTVRYRNNMSTGSDEVMERDSGNSDVNNEVDWHEKASAIQFVIKSNPGQSQGPGSQDMFVEPEREGYNNAAYSPDNSQASTRRRAS